MHCFFVICMNSFKASDSYLCEITIILAWYFSIRFLTNKENLFKDHLFFWSFKVGCRPIIVSFSVILFFFKNSFAYALSLSETVILGIKSYELAPINRTRLRYFNIIC